MAKKSNVIQQKTESSSQRGINVSIVVPCCNVEKYLDKCLGSIVNQTLKEIEIICINDGSKDGTLNIIKKYAVKDNRIVVVDKPNSGYGDSMNIGFSKARGRYIGIVESDDFIEPKMFETLYRTAREYDADVVKSNFWFYWSDPERNELHEYFRKEECGKIICPHEYDNGSLYGRKPSIWSAIYKREFIEKNNISFLPTPGASFQDTSFTFKVYSSAKKMVCIYDAFLHYRQDNENSSVNNADKKAYCVCDEYEEIEKFIHNQLDKEKRDQLYKIYGAAFYDTCIWMYERLGIKKRFEFLDYVSSWFARIDKTVGITALDFGSCWWKTRDMQRIAYNPFEYHVWRNVERYEQSGSSFVYDVPSIPLNNKISNPEGKSPFFSVIVPVYNNEKYLPSCLDSLIFQTFSDFEVICINDGSTDHSLSVLEKYAKTDERIKILNRENSGPAKARNIGLESAAGKYILFLDSDDYYSLKCCETIHNKLEKDAASDDVVMFGTELYPETPRASEWHYSVLTTPDTHYDKISQTDLLSKPYLKVYSWRCCFSAAFIKKNTLRFKSDFRYGEDALFMAEAMLKLKGLSVISDKLYYYRHFNPDSLMNQINKDHAEYTKQQMRILVKMLEIYKANGIVPSAELLEYCCDFIYSSISQCPEPQRSGYIRDFVMLIKENGLDVHVNTASDNCRGFWSYCKGEYDSYRRARSIGTKFRNLVKKLFPPSRQAFYDYSTQMVNCINAQQSTINELRGQLYKIQNDLNDQINRSKQIEWYVREIVKKYNDDQVWKMPVLINKTESIIEKLGNTVSESGDGQTETVSETTNEKNSDIKK